tara:strand:+ start:3303 stop:3701 length:399 start_codon:yes stop_codon:yes gene_type:complete
VARRCGTGFAGRGLRRGGRGILPGTGGTQSAFAFSRVHIKLAICTLFADVGGGGGRGDRIRSRPARGTLRGVRYERVESFRASIACPSGVRIGPGRGEAGIAGTVEGASGSTVCCVGVFGAGITVSRSWRSI